MDKNFLKRNGTFEMAEKDSTSEKMVVRGYFAVFNQKAEIFPEYFEEIRKGAFLESIEKNDIRVLFGHEMNNLLARSGNGTAKFWEDDYGLFGEVELPNTSLGRDVFELIKTRTLDKCSIGFFYEDYETERENQREKIAVKKANLIEVSFVTFPAYDGTSITARQELLAEENKKELKQIKERKLKCLKSI